MKEKINFLIKHPLISGSSIIFIGSFLANILNYVFNLIMGRFLTVSDYGLLMSLSSLLALFTIFPSVLINIFAKFSAKYKAVEDKNSFNALISSGFKLVLIIGFLIFFSLLMSTLFFASFLHISDLKLIFIIFFAIFVSILYSLPAGVFQGEMKFTFLSFINVLMAVIKVIVGVVLVLLGLKVFGAIIGIFLSLFFIYLITSFAIFKEHKNGNIKKLNTSIFLKEFKTYSVKFFFASIGITILSTADVILVRHFFDPFISGQYAALSLMGKAIFYLTGPIYFVFFPLIAHKREKKEKVLSTLLLAGSVITLVSLGLSLIYFIYPQLVLKIFFPSKEYLALTPFLGPFSLYILIFSIANLFSSFFLSIGKTGIYKINLLIAIIFILLIFLFHSSLHQIIIILFSVSLLLLIFLIIYYIYNGKD